jgi:GNAT superfamily N-acetyltransferase
VRFPLSVELFRRLPRHPDWRYERFDGQAVLSPRPRPVHLRRATGLRVPGAPIDAEVRALDLQTDRISVAALLLDVWLAEDPYRSLENSAEILGPEVERGLDTASFGAVAVASGAVCAVALVDHGRSGAPLLNWLSVARNARERGLATALLRLVSSELSARGVSELVSAASAANVPSLRWHLTRGFYLDPDPLRDALRSHLRRAPAQTVETGRGDCEVAAVLEPDTRATSAGAAQSGRKPSTQRKQR